MTDWNQVVQSTTEQGLLDDRERKLQLSMDQATGTTAQGAQIADISRKQNLPYDVAERNISELSKGNKYSNLNLYTLLKDSPTTGNFLIDPVNASQAHNDANELSAIEKVIRGYKRGQITDIVGQKGYEQLVDYNPERQKQIDTLNTRIQSLTVGKQEDGFFSNWADPTAEIVGQMLVGLADSVDEGMIGAVAFMSATAAAGQAGPQALAPEELVTVPAAGIAGYGYGSAVGMAKHAFKVESGQSYLEMLSLKDESGAGIDPEVARYAAMSVGVINASLEMIGVKAVSAPFRATLKQATSAAVKDALRNPTMRDAIIRFGKNYAMAWGGEVSTEVLQEVVSMGAAELAKELSDSDIEKMTPEQWGDRVLEIFDKVGHGMVLLALPGASINLASDISQSRAGKSDQQKLAALSKAVGKSELKNQNAAAFRDLMTKLGEDTGTDKVYLDPQGAAVFFQSGEFTADDSQAEIVDSIKKDIPLAMEEGRDIEISMADYAAYVAGTNLESGLVDHMHLDADALTPAQTFNQDVRAEIQRLAAMSNEELAAEAEVYNDVLGQLLAIGTERSTAEQYAMLHEAFFSTMASRSNQRPIDLFRKYNPKVKREVPEALRARARAVDQIDILLDRLRAGDVPASADIFGDSLTEFIRKQGGILDDGGELAARDADIGKVGRNRLTNKNGRSLDDLAEAAVESGYIKNRTEQDLLDAIDRELAGDPVYALGAENPELMNIRRDIEELDAILGGAGLDIQALDNAALKDALLSDVPPPTSDLSPPSEGVVSGGTPTISPEEMQARFEQKDDKRRTDKPVTADARQTDRRQDESRRDRIDQLTMDEKYDLIYRDPLTGINNRRAFNEDIGDYPVVVSLDVDALKTVNDNLGQDAGDQMLVAVANALHDATNGHAYHISGDEFYVLGDDQAAMEASLKAAQAALAAQQITSEKGTMDGVGLSYGIGGDKASADTAMKEQKKAREASGERPARGELPASMRLGGKPELLSQPMHTGNEPVYLMGELVHDAMMDSFLNVLDENASASEVMDAIEDFTPEQQRFLNSLNTNDWLGFDYPSQAISAALSEDIADFEVSHGLKQAIARLVMYWNRENYLYQPSNNYTAGGQKEMFDAGGGVISFAEKDDGKELSKDKFATVVGMEEVRRVDLRTPTISTPEELAIASRVLMPKAQEVLLAIVTNKNGKVISVLNHSLGGRAQASVDPGIVAGWAASVEGGSELWLTHNHPSGAVELSSADKVISARIGNLIDGSGISLRGISAVTPQGRFTFQSLGASPSSEKLEGETKTGVIGDGAPGHTQPLLERVIFTHEKLSSAAITSPDSAKHIIADVTKGESGIVLLDTAHHPIAFLPINEWSDLRRIRDSGNHRRLLSALHRSNADAAIINAPTDPDASPGVNNAAAMLENSGIRLLDILSKDGSQSARGVIRVPPVFHQSSYSDTPQSSNGQPLFQGGKKPRGTFNLATNEITLSPNADLSTFLHESGHLFLTIMEDMAPEHADIQAEMDILNRWWEANGATTMVQRQEQFASGFEAYLMEGKAPSAELAPVFARFKAWLTMVYKKISSVFASNNLKDIQLSDEVRGVMDRMLASKEAIDRAAGEAKLMHPFHVERLGLSPQEAEEYQAMVNAAHDEADAALTQQVMREMQREKEDWWKRGLADAIAEVRAEMDALPEYAARDYLSGDRVPEGMPAMQLDAAYVKEVYGNQAAKRLRRMSEQGGSHPNQVASLFGYRSGDELIRALLATMNKADREKAIIQQATERMRQLHGDLMLEGLDQAAQKEVHNTKQAERLLAELRWLNRAAGTKSATPRAYFKQAAEDYVRGLPISELRPDIHRRNEIKARNNAIKAVAEGDFKRAAMEQHRVVRQFYLYQEATKAKERAERYRKRLNQIARGKYSARSVDPDYIQQVKVLLAAFDMRKNPKDSFALLDRVNNFIAAQQASNPDLIAGSLLDGITSWKEMTVDDLQAVRDAAENLLTMGKKNSELALEVYRAEVDDLAASLDDNRVEAKKPESARSGVTRMKKARAQFAASHRKLESLLQEADGWKDTGAAQRKIFMPLWNAQLAEVERLALEHEELAKVFDGFDYLFSAFKDNLQDIEALRKYTDTYEMPLPEGGTLLLSRAERLALALNWGNEGNREALRNQKTRPMSDAIVLQAIQTLTPEELGLVNRIWEYVDKFYPELARIEQAATGVAPAKVDASPFVLNGVSMRGGYYPLQADSSLSWRAEMHEVEARAERMKQGGSIRASTKHGSTIERTQFGGQEVNISIDGLFKHVDGVVHDITHREAVREVDRLLRNEKIRERMIKSLGSEGYRAVNQTVTRLAGGTTHPSDLAILNKLMRFSRVAASYGAMGYSVSTALLNLTGFMPAMTEVGKQRMMHALFQEMANPNKFGEAIVGKSVFMANRAETIQRDVYAILRTMRGNSKWTAFQQYAFWMIQKVDGFVSRMVWQAAYNKALESGENLTYQAAEAHAITQADRTVARTQGTGLKIDLSAVEDQSEVYRALSPMYTYFNAILSLKIRQKGKLKTGQINKLEYMESMFWMFIATAMAEEFMRGSTDDGEEPPDTTKRYGQAIAGYYLGQWFGIRELSGYVRYGMMFEAPHQRVIVAPFRALDEYIKVAFDPEKQMGKGTLRATTDLLPVLGFPSGAQVNRLAAYLMDVNASGEDVSLYKLLVTGKTDNTDLERLFGAGE